MKLENRDEVVVGEYRYYLCGATQAEWRGEGQVAWVMLNPSVAGKERNDPTFLRVGDFTCRLGYRRAAVVNLLAYRTPYPHHLPRNIELATGPDNDRHIEAAIRASDLVIVAWGSGGNRSLRRMIDDRAAIVRAIAAGAGKPLMALGLTGDGSPKHPLARGRHRIPDDAIPQPWSLA